MSHRLGAQLRDQFKAIALLGRALGSTGTRRSSLVAYGISVPDIAYLARRQRHSMRYLRIRDDTQKTHGGQRRIGRQRGIAPCVTALLRLESFQLCNPPCPQLSTTTTTIMPDVSTAHRVVMPLPSSPLHIRNDVINAKRVFMLGLELRTMLDFRTALCQLCESMLNLRLIAALCLPHTIPDLSTAHRAVVARFADAHYVDLSVVDEVLVVRLGLAETQPPSEPDVAAEPALSEGIRPAGGICCCNRHVLGQDRT
eukprot:3932207-Rhodomonas_salina.3